MNNQDLTSKIQNLVLETLRITDSTDVPDMEVVVKIDDAPFAIKGDISVVGGKEKAGKTSSAIFIIATALMDSETKNVDTLKIQSSYCKGKDVIFVDTEQSKSSTKKFVQNVSKILGRKMPSNFYAYNLRSLYRAEEKKEALMRLFEKHNEAHFWVIDGLADLVSDPNLPEPSNALIAELMSIAEKNHTSIMGFIHENPGLSTKFRGNLGSELQRKCYGAIGIKKDKDKGVHCMESRLLRHSGDFQDVYFRFDKDLGRMVSLNPEEAEDYKSDASGEKEKRDLRYKLAQQCLVGGSERIRHNEFVRRIRNHAPLIEGKTLSETTAKNRIKEMLEFEIVEKTKGDRYHLIPEKNDSKGESEKK